MDCPDAVLPPFPRVSAALECRSGGPTSPGSANRIDARSIAAGERPGDSRITPANVAFALFLAYLEGRLAQRLFSSDWVKVLDLSEERLIELTQSAAQRGLLVFRRTGGVMEVRFPDYITTQEQEWLSEQA